MDFTLTTANDNAPDANAPHRTAPVQHSWKYKRQPAKGELGFQRFGKPKTRRAGNDNPLYSAPPPNYAGAGVAPLRHRLMTERPSVIVTRGAAIPDDSPVWTPKFQRDKNAAPTPASAPVYAIIALAWVGSIVANIAAMLFAPSNSLHLIAVIVAIWTSLTMVYVAQSRQQTMLAELASLAAIGAFTLALYVTSLRFGLFAPPAMGVALSAFAAVTLGLITGSKLALRLSAATALVWAVMSLTGDGITALNLHAPDISWLGFPALLGLQSLASSRFKDGVAMNISVIAAYLIGIGGLTGLTLSGTITPVMAAGAAMIFGLLHSRIGKYLDSRDRVFAGLHTAWGWAAMMTGMIALQDFWTRPDMMPWSPSEADAMLMAPSRVTLLGGLSIAGAALALAFILIVMRREKGFGRWVQGLSITGLAGGLAFASLYPSRIEVPLATYGISANPMIGIIIGGAALAICLAMIANGFRRHRPMSVALGAIALAGSVTSLLPTLMNNFDASMIYAVSAFVSAMIAASLTAQGPNAVTQSSAYYSSFGYTA